MAADAACAQWTRTTPDQRQALAPDLLALRERIPGVGGAGLTEMRRQILRIRAGG
jgi:hypothetical protein